MNRAPQWIPFELLQPNCELTFEFLVTDGEYIYRAWIDHERWYCEEDESRMTHWMSYKQIPLPNGTMIHGKISTQANSLREIESTHQIE